MGDEWCLIAQLDGDEEAVAGVADSLIRHFSAAGRVTRAGSVLRVYSDSEALAAEAEEVVLGVLDETPLGYELWQERWDEERGEWEEIAPDAVEEVGGEGPAPDEVEAEPAESRGEPVATHEQPPPVVSGSASAGDWAVIVAFEDDREAESFGAHLEGQGIALKRRGDRLAIRVPSASEAAELASRLQVQAPLGARIETRPARGLLKRYLS